ncbi:MAG: F0F1 ATP synthase subunit A [Puniceicoccaceae bacterium]
MPTRLMRVSLIPLLVLASASSVWAAGGVSPSAYTLIDIPITNSMVTGWVFSLLLVFLIRRAVGSPQLVPSKGQAVVETVVIGIRDLVEPIVGKRMVGPIFPLLISLFLFILIHNWSGLFPGVGAFGTVSEDGSLKYFFRPANADLNMTLGLGLAAAIFGWGFFVLKYAGPKALVKDLFGNKADPREMSKGIFLGVGVIFVFVGLIELFSILLRPLSLAVRLFGNVYGGENLLETANSMGVLAFLIPVPIYFLEMLIGLVQALVFTLLTATYVGLICNHGEEEHH